jgi:putative PLP-dependent aminotransferase (TIGR04422 family)
MRKTAVFIWPDANFRRALLASWHGVSLEALETKLGSLFPSGHPVICSSGRAALTLCVAHQKLTRADAVDIFPFASHCVLDAVARNATPRTYSGSATQLRIAYHQWGYVQERALNPSTIEDCADTLCAPSTSLFPGGGKLEIWSLPKIVATLGGGVIWCRSKADALSVQQLRDQAGGKTSQWLMRLLGHWFPLAHLWWQGAEASLGRPSSLQLGEIAAALDNWDNVVQDRREKLEIARPLAPAWLSMLPGRLPSVMPVELGESSDKLADEFRLSAGTRHFEVVEAADQRRFVKVLPVPIHQTMDKTSLEIIVRRLAPLIHAR